MALGVMLLAAHGRAADAGPVARGPLLGVAVEAGDFSQAGAAAVLGPPVRSITPENAMKMDALQPRPGRWSFGTADALVAEARARGMRVRGHTLIWHRQQPPWLAGRVWTRPELLAVLRDHVRTTVGHFRGRVAEWDVVNEPLAADGTLRESVWLRVIGPTYIEEALRAARAADPRARLVINDYNAERAGPKRDGLLALARRLRARGAPLDGVGLQGHVRTDWHPTADELRETFREFGRLGLSVGVTELDVEIRGAGAQAERSARQAEVYRLYGEACASAGCRGLTVWGLRDDRSWLGADAEALPFRSDYSPKPAWGALLTALGSGVSSASGTTPAAPSRG